MFAFTRIFASSVLWAWSLAAAAQVAIFPASPKPDETVRVQTPLVDALLEAKISMEGSKITLEVWVPGSDFPVPPARPPLDLPIGRYPAGSYQVEVIRRVTGFPQATSSLGTAAFSVMEKSYSAPILDHTGLWWDPNQSGWALNIVQQSSGIVFVTWFTYDPDGTPTWYSVSSGQWLAPSAGEPRAPSVYVGDVHRTSVPPGSAAFDPSKVTRTLVGQLRLAFNDRQWGGPARAEITINGITAISNLQRFEF